MCLRWGEDSVRFASNLVHNENCAFPHFVGVIGCDNGKTRKKGSEKEEFWVLTMRMVDGVWVSCRALKDLCFNILELQLNSFAGG